MLIAYMCCSLQFWISFYLTCLWRQVQYFHKKMKNINLAAYLQQFPLKYLCTPVIISSL